MGSALRSGRGICGPDLHRPAHSLFETAEDGDHGQSRCGAFRTRRRQLAEARLGRTLGRDLDDIGIAVTPLVPANSGVRHSVVRHFPIALRRRRAETHCTDDRRRYPARRSDRYPQRPRRRRRLCTRTPDPQSARSETAPQRFSVDLKPDVSLVRFGNAPRTAARQGHADELPAKIRHISIPPRSASCAKPISPRRAEASGGEDQGAPLSNRHRRRRSSTARSRRPADRMAIPRRKTDAQKKARRFRWRARCSTGKRRPVAICCKRHSQPGAEAANGLLDLAGVENPRPDAKGTNAMRADRFRFYADCFLTEGGKA